MAVAVISLLVFGANNFVLPAMLAIVALLFVGRKQLDKGERVCR